LSAVGLRHSTRRTGFPRTSADHVVVSFSAPPDDGSAYVMVVQQSVTSDVVHEYPAGIGMSTVVHRPLALSANEHVL
jgi:hypothetical protein